MPAAVGVDVDVNSTVVVARVVMVVVVASGLKGAMVLVLIVVVRAVWACILRGLALKWVWGLTRRSGADDVGRGCCGIAARRVIDAQHVVRIIYSNKNVSKHWTT